MTQVLVVDQTLGIGQQYLWGSRMRAGMVLPVTSQLDRTGYDSIDLAIAESFRGWLRDCHEDPWQSLELLAEALVRTRLRAAVLCNSLDGASVTPDCVMDLWVRCLLNRGIRGFCFYDPLQSNIDKMHRLSALAKAGSAQVVLTLNFADTPIHTDEYFANRAKELACTDNVDRIALWDAAGVLTADRVRTLVPSIKRSIRNKELEIVSQNVLGISSPAYLAAIENGANIIHTSSRPLANGSSLPSIEAMNHNLRLAGHTTALDSNLLPLVAEHFEMVARVSNFPGPETNEYDLFVLEHQLPGGDTSEIRSELARRGEESQLDRVLREIAAVRARLGYPAMVGPLAPLIQKIAIKNVLSGTQYEDLPEEAVGYAFGCYGTLSESIDPIVQKKIAASPLAAKFRDKMPQPELDEIREQNGNVSDEELLLRFLIHESDVQSLYSLGQVRTDFAPLTSPALMQAVRLIQLSGARSLDVSTPQLKIALRR
jgi:oxaloacetate decarboxylase (Na+ extruding) subunit alpha